LLKAWIVLPKRGIRRLPEIGETCGSFIAFARWKAKEVFFSTGSWIYIWLKMFGFTHDSYGGGMGVSLVQPGGDARLSIR